MKREKNIQSKVPKREQPKDVPAIQARVLEALTEVTSQRVQDHKMDFISDVNRSQASVEFLERIVDAEDSSPFDAMVHFDTKSRSKKADAIRELVELRDENAELMLSKQQNGERLKALRAELSEVNHHGTGEICKAWRRNVHHISSLVLIAVEERLYSQRREMQLMQSSALASHSSSVIAANNSMMTECAQLEAELGAIEKEGETLDEECRSKWFNREECFEELPHSEYEWTQRLHKIRNSTMAVPNPVKQLLAVEDILHALAQITKTKVCNGSNVDPVRRSKYAAT